MNRRGFFGALVGLTAGAAVPRPANAWGTPTANRTIVIDAWDVERTRALVNSREFCDAISDAIQRNGHQLRTRLRSSLE